MNIANHLIERHIDLELHTPIINYEESCATFLCWNLSGKLCGYQTYRPLCDKTMNNNPYNCRYFTYRNKNYPTILVWGIESYYISNGPIFITEGIFDAARITKRGYTAFATLTNKPPKDYRNWLQMLNRPIISICDNDIAGSKLSFYSDFFEIVPDIYKDLGNSPEDYVNYLLIKYAT